MRQLFQIAKPLTWSTLLIFCGSAFALEPQTGIYWSPNRPGWAFYVENQRDTVFVAVYAYSPIDNEPEFYISSGALLPSIESDAEPLEGVYPIQGFIGDFFRVPSGACLSCPYTPFAPAQSVGLLTLKFPGRGGMYASIQFNDGTRFPNPFMTDGIYLRRFNFAIGGVLANPGDLAPIFEDMRGEWVFSDQTDPLRVPWRFHFTVREDGADLSEFDLQASVAFRDVSRNAVMYCFVPSIRGLTGPQIQALPYPACELRQSGESIFWTTAEYSIDEFVGTLGSAPPRSARIYRGPQRVLGRRISD